ncbi:hypothetical protein [Metabacillus sp. RGM 3146]|uniref:hypothetical protein n=1 Tax=Metabacillus sp. RGM 3146 TaxID=3401092 RepID=UPI003B993087
MTIAIMLVVLVGVLSLIFTILIGGKGEKEYTSSTKKNLTNLTFIYVLLAFILIGGLGLYLYFK